MRTVNLNQKAQMPSKPERLARLTRHLRARLLDLGAGTPELEQVCQEEGTITARFPGRTAEEMMSRLREHGVSCTGAGERVCFCIPEELPFEDLDYVWGCLFQILGS